MHYCDICKTLYEDACPKSGHQVREPRDNDPVFLMKADGVRAGMLQALLTQADIPLLKEGMLGAGMTTWAGGMLEVFSLYVPFAALEKARDVVGPLQTENDTPED